MGRKSRLVVRITFGYVEAMKLPEHPFAVTDWSAVPSTRHAGETGHAIWRTAMMGEARIRIVEYSPGYLADHWCDRGHVVLVLEGELVSELRDGREFVLRTGMSYRVSDFGDSPHRSRTTSGCRLFIVD